MAGYRALTIRVCPRHGALNVVDDERRFAPNCRVCGQATELVEHTPAEQLRGAVERAERAEKALLLRSGYFQWGKNGWIHEDDEGTVMSTADALDDLRGR